MKIHFNVTSALNSPFGVFSLSERMQQTQETFNSIRYFYPDASITIIETGRMSLTSDQKEFIKNNNVELFELNEDPFVIEVYNKYILLSNHGVVKNLLVTYATNKYLSNANFDVDTNFVAIMSGRYRLSKEFVPDMMHNKISLPHPVVEINKDACWTAGMDKQYLCYFYAWDIALTQTIADLHCKMHNEIKQELMNGKNFDIEHLMYKFTLKDLIYHTDQFKIEGFVASSGANL
jgi:hypothetical protein